MIGRLDMLNTAILLANQYFSSTVGQDRAWSIPLIFALLAQGSFASIDRGTVFLISSLTVNWLIGRMMWPS
jgi:hypothetical protein